MAKRTPGLRKKGEIWHIEKIIAGQLVRKSTGETELEQAERYLAKLITERRKEAIYGERLDRTFDFAAARYIEDFSYKRSIERDIISLQILMPYIGDISLSKLHMGALEGFINDRKKAGISAGTLNRDISIIRRILSLSARLWRDENGNTWIDTIPMFPAVEGVKRKPRPISWDEQERLIKALPAYLADMVLFALNTGLRVQEICNLKWSDECKVSGLETSVFIISEERAKNEYERIVPLNSVSRSIIESKRGINPEHVFTWKGHKLSRIRTTSFIQAREEAGLNNVRVHDLRHTFGMRLRAAGVDFEDRQDLLGHYAGRITTHYSKVEISRLIDCVELLCESRKPELTLIRRVV